MKLPTRCESSTVACTELWIAHTQIEIYEHCKNESIVVVISGNWEKETGLLV